MKEKPLGEDLVESYAETETTEEADAMAASRAPTTNKDDLAAIYKMKNAVNERFDELKESISRLNSALSVVSERVSSTEAAVESHKKRLDELERRHESLASGG